MAKKKAAPASKSSTAPKKAAPKKPTSKSAAKRTVPINTEQVGVTAGQVWQVLSECEGLTAAALKKSIDMPGDLVMAAVGWLAREEKLRFDTSGRTAKIMLR